MKSGKSMFKLTHSQWISVAILVSSLGLAAAVTVPNVFTSGTPINAAAVNANFAAIKTAIDALQAPKTVRIGVMPYTYEPENSGVTWGGCGLVGSIPFRSMTAGAPMVAAAPVSFPDGATVTSLDAMIFDTVNPGRITVYLKRFDAALSTSTIIGQVGSTDVDAAGSMTKTLALSHTVDNTSPSSYYLVWEQTVAGGSCSAIGLYSTSVSYTK